ncbi:hypothetical protein [Metabacillus fastidiosus]|uniref:hypothetical protein n=1 Tax=Metabacillus fastidiosus TaxID=1458 RepID=UPI003D2DA1D1
MAQRNYMNVNEVFPILDMINRKLNQNKGTSFHFDSPLTNDGTGSNERFDTSQWEVESFEMIRDTANQIDPDIIKEVTIVYRNGAIDTITLTRGLNPPVPETVPETVPEHKYINNLMIVEVEIRTEWFGKIQEVKAVITREDGYKKFQRVDLIYDDSDWIEMEGEGDDTEGYDNPNDFYDGGGSDEGYDHDSDTAEDYADYPYTPQDEVEQSDDGWADGYDPSTPVDFDLYDPIDEQIEDEGEVS